MKKENVFILGAGGMAREVKAYYDDLGNREKLGGFVEQNSHRAGQDLRGITILDSDQLPDPENALLIAGIGSPLRKKWIEQLEEDGYRFDVLVHNSAYVGENVELGQGCIICPQAVITTDVRLGKHCILNVKASVSHDCRIGDYVTVCPGATIGGRVQIGDETWVGIGATIIQGVNIGKRVFIAAGAVIIDNIPDNSLVTGVPGKVVRILNTKDWKTLI